MRVIVSQRVVVPLLVLALLATVIPAFLLSPIMVPRMVSAGVSTCSAGVDLVTNGSFESPGVPTGFIQGGGYNPTGWTGPGGVPASLDVTGSALPADLQGPIPIVGEVYVQFLRAGVSQALPTQGLGAATLTVSLTARPQFAPVVQIGGVSVALAPTGATTLSGTTTLPAITDATTLLTIGGYQFGGPFEAEVDAISVTVTNCPAVTPTFATPDLEVTEGNAGTTPVTVVLDSPFPVGAQYNYTTSDGTARSGTDYIPTSGTLTCAVSTGCPTLSFTVTVLGDTTVEPDETFGVTVSGTGISPVSDTITILNDDDTPPVARDQTLTTPEDTPFDAPLRIVPNATDPDGDPITQVNITGWVTAVNGSVTINNPYPGFITYTPVANFSGTDSFRYTVTANGQTSNEATITVIVTPVNDAPVAQDDRYTTAEDTSLTVAAPGVLGNDSDVDTGTTLTAVLVSGPGNGSVTLNRDGSFTYIPAANFSGTDSFTYTASDGTATSNVATATITVAGTNDAPVIDPTSVPAPIVAAQTTPAGAVVTYPTPTATDIDGDPVTVTCAPASGSTFAPGTTTVICTARDGNGGEDTETFTVTVTDQGAPVFTGLPNVTVGATSNYGAVVSYALPTATDNAGTPTVSCLPAPGSQFPIGQTTVTCTASDGVNVTTGSFTVTVTPNGFRDPRDPRPGASPITQPPPTPTPRPARPPRG